TFSILLGSNNKLLHIWFPIINYEWGFKAVHISLVGIAYGLLHYLKSNTHVKWKKIINLLIYFSYFLILLVIVLQAKHILLIQPLYALLVLISILGTFLILVQLSYKTKSDGLLMLLSLIALISSLFWW